MQRAELEPVAPYKGAEAIAPELAAIIHRATARSVDHRYPSVKALADDVRRFLRGEPTLALPASLRVWGAPLKRLIRWPSVIHRCATAPQE